MKMDLLDFTPKTDDITITLKVGETVLTNADKSEMTITFYSPYSKEAKAVKHGIVDERIAKAEKSGENKFSSAEADAINTLALARNIKSWNITIDKKQPKLTEKTAIEVLEKAFWIEGLYKERVENSLDFMKG
jgi:hypothetical protein